MRIIETECTVSYHGRGDTFRELGTRLLIIKDDKSFLVHRSTGVKPLNYMTHTVSIEERVNEMGLQELIVKSKDEQIVIVMHNVIMDITLPMAKDTTKNIMLGTEAQLQAWMARLENWNAVFGSNRLYVAREIDVGNGAVDLLGINRDTNKLIVVEMKRHAKKNDVFQVERYREALATMSHNRMAIRKLIDAAVSKAEVNEATDEAIMIMKGLSEHSFIDPECWLVASDLESGTTKFAQEHGITAVPIGDDWVNESINVDEARSTAVSPRLAKRKHGSTSNLMSLLS